MFYIKRDSRHENSACWIEKKQLQEEFLEQPHKFDRGAHLSRHCGISVSFLGGEDGAVDMSENVFISGEEFRDEMRCSASLEYTE